MSAARSGLAWDGTAAAVAAVAALPAGLLALADVHAGAAVAVGVLPAAITGVAPRRRRRVRAALVAALIGACMVAGGVLAAVPVVAVAAIAGLGVGTAWLAARSRLGVLAMTLALPMVGIGLSFDAGEAAAAAALILAGGLWAWLVSLAWPERPPPAPPGSAAGGAAPTLAYGVRLGAAGATAAAIGFLLDLDHVGWPVAAALLVMRPAAEMQRLRTAGRVASVLAGALAGAGLAAWDPPAAVYAVAILAAVAAAAGTHPSRWYVTPAFTTFLVFLIFLSADPDDAGARFDERVGETVLGVAIAAVFGKAGSRRERPG
jgi:hypothetical protein